MDAAQLIAVKAPGVREVDHGPMNHAVIGRVAPALETGREWTRRAIAALDVAGCATDTPMLELVLASFPHVRFLLKDESVHPSGSLKHRLARSLFLYALCSGQLAAGQGCVDASSGSTAISEAWFARRLGLPFTAVMPRDTATAKQRAVDSLGGSCELVEPGVDLAVHARSLALARGEAYLDQFGLASTATDWRGNNNIAQSILAQCRQLHAGDPAWVVCGAGTGGTSATVGRYLRLIGSDARVCVAEALDMAFARGWRLKDRAALARGRTCIEGIGRPRVEPCFAFELVDEVLEIADTESIAACLLLERLTGIRYGGSSGTNFAAALALAQAMRARNERGAIVLLLGDRGDRYADTLFCPRWRRLHGMDPQPALRTLGAIAGSGRLR